MSGIPGLITIDHVALTVPDLEEATRFYTDVLGGRELYAMGPFDAAELPATPDGRDWGEAHLNVAGARVRFRVIEVGDVTLELIEYDRLGYMDERWTRSQAVATRDRRARCDGAGRGAISRRRCG